MNFSASAATKDAARLRRRRFCTPPRFFSTLPHMIADADFFTTEVWGRRPRYTRFQKAQLVALSN